MTDTWMTWAGIFDVNRPIDHFYRSHETTLVAEIENLHDRDCERQEESYTIRQMVKKHTIRLQPDLQWDKIIETGSETVKNVVKVRYGIPNNSDKHGVPGLYLGLPVGVTDARSEFVHFGETQSGPKPMLIVEFRIPRDMWDGNGPSWFAAVRDEDFRWLKRAVRTHADAESQHNSSVVELTHRLVKERYKIVMDLPLALGAMPLPTDVTETEDNRTKEFRNPRYRVHKQILFGQQQGACKGCGEEFIYGDLTLDHVVPTSKGGPDEFDNLQLLCYPCNHEKDNGTMDDLNAALESRRGR